MVAERAGPVEMARDVGAIAQEAMGKDLAAAVLVASGAMAAEAEKVVAEAVAMAAAGGAMAAEVGAMASGFVVSQDAAGPETEAEPMAV